nr:RNA-directed DNA polymerase, eukaryota [Tanacetum cinerariifolium]
MITSTWNSFTLVDSNGMIRFKKKLQLLKKVIRKWVTEYKSIHSNSIRDVKNKLIDIDKLLDKGGVTDDVLLSRMESMKQLQELNSSDNCDFVQKAKVRWAIEGDENYKFFHASVLDEEIRKDVWGCGENKSPGPDGFTFEFFRKFWTVVAPDFCIAVKCLNSGKDSVLVNGSPTLEFQFHRGLKPGDPLAPFLFILIMESLHLSFNRAVEAGGNMSLVKSWDETVHKLTKRLSKWKLKTLSIGGRLTLLKSVLGSTPIYNMSIFKVPKTVLNKMKNLRRNFSMVFKKEIERLRRIGNGLHTRFWKDLWIGDCILSGLFPHLFALDTVKDISVAGKLQSPLVSSFRRNVRGGIEEQQLGHLVDLLDSVILSNSNDRWVSDLNGDGVFRVKDVMNLLDEFFLPRADVPTRWVKNILINVNIFAWRLALDRFPTRANLVQRNVVTES